MLIACRIFILNMHHTFKLGKWAMWIRIKQNFQLLYWCLTKQKMQSNSIWVHLINKSKINTNYWMSRISHLLHSLSIMTILRVMFNNNKNLKLYLILGMQLKFNLPSLWQRKSKCQSNSNNWIIMLMFILGHCDS